MTTDTLAKLAEIEHSIFTKTYLCKCTPEDYTMTQTPVCIEPDNLPRVSISPEGNRVVRTVVSPNAAMIETVLSRQLRYTGDKETDDRVARTRAAYNFTVDDMVEVLDKGGEFVFTSPADVSEIADTVWDYIDTTDKHRRAAIHTCIEVSDAEETYHKLSVFLKKMEHLLNITDRMRKDSGFAADMNDIFKEVGFTMGGSNSLIDDILNSTPSVDDIVPVKAVDEKQSAAAYARSRGTYSDPWDNL